MDDDIKKMSKDHRVATNKLRSLLRKIVKAGSRDLINNNKLYAKTETLKFIESIDDMCSRNYKRRRSHILSELTVEKSLEMLLDLDPAYS